ncbi:hypothetical protein PoB_001450800 [Plakobranchus ocellatus]|uniref:Uncharacterized protein n=1 Tax=Plakobranchus ocellatus TaxID=259542 RepID=A0AAV3Z055_9GAST|nr:hypothetical protein PoB_001450800 [Plakobranchus ocellatus]
MGRRETCRKLRTPAYVLLHLSHPPQSQFILRSGQYKPSDDDDDDDEDCTYTSCLGYEKLLHLTEAIICVLPRLTSRMLISTNRSAEDTQDTSMRFLLDDGRTIS